MADGSQKPIESIGVGDMVLAYDEATGEMKPDKVSVVHDPVEWDHYLLVNGALKLTPPHPVLTDGEWVAIGELEIGDSLTAADGSKVLIESLEVVSEPVTVYNFATNPYQTYVAGGFIVHNKNPYLPGETDPGTEPGD
jgi:intein/homing endonuclease